MWCRAIDGIVMETGFEGLALQGRLPAWISGPTAGIASTMDARAAVTFKVRRCLSENARDAAVAPNELRRLTGGVVLGPGAARRSAMASIGHLAF
jgi:hypothetical protein